MFFGRDRFGVGEKEKQLLQRLDRVTGAIVLSVAYGALIVLLGQLVM